MQPSFLPDGFRLITFFIYTIGLNPNFFYICAKPFPLLAYGRQLYGLPIHLNKHFLSLALTQIKGLKGQQNKAFFLHWLNAKDSMEKLTKGGDSKISASKEAGDYKS